MDVEPLSLALYGGAATLIGFALLWLLELRDEDASFVDVGWAGSLGALAAFYGAVGSGDVTRRLGLALVVGSWSMRLASHIYQRHRGQPEDERYQALRARWGERAHTFFFFFYQAQAVLALFLSVPFLLIAFNPAPSFHALEIIGLLLVVLGIIGETVADRQLTRHRADPARRGQTCREGLWRYSRHPNYFFEWLVWCGFALVALPAPRGWLGLASPMVMLYLILKVTGIPPTEERALQSRGDDYRNYQETTSAFVPWFPRREHSS